VRIITRTEAPVEPTVSSTCSTATASYHEAQDWRQILAQSFRSADALLGYLGLPDDGILAPDHPALAFPLLVPRPYADGMTRGNPNDPLLRQVLPLAAEGLDDPAFVTDPLAEAASNQQPGILHKYQGRVLMLTTTGCAVNCRYCFRRHFAYEDNRLSREQRLQALDYIRQDDSIQEVILSGGDPLMLQDDALATLIDGIEGIPHVTRLRIHSRLPVVIPQRITPALIQRLSDSRLNVCLVIHANHAAELTPAHEGLNRLHKAGIHVLNQSVLLKGVNDDLSILSDLSNKLFTFGVLPYYLHLPDNVAGTQHYFVSDDEGRMLYRELRKILPGYLVPQLVREIPGAPYKQPMMMSC